MSCSLFNSCDLILIGSSLAYDCTNYDGLWAFSSEWSDAIRYGYGPSGNGFRNSSLTWVVSPGTYIYSYCAIT